MLSLCHQLLIEFNKEEGLFLDIGKEVIVTNHLEDIGSAKAEEVW